MARDSNNLVKEITEYSQSLRLSPSQQNPCELKPDIIKEIITWDPYNRSDIPRIRNRKPKIKFENLKDIPDGSCLIDNYIEIISNLAKIEFWKSIQNEIKYEPEIEFDITIQSTKKGYTGKISNITKFGIPFQIETIETENEDEDEDEEGIIKQDDLLLVCETSNLGNILETAKRNGRFTFVKKVKNNICHLSNVPFSGNCYGCKANR